MANPWDEIKLKLNIVEIISGYNIELKQAGANFKAKCPFHSEKTPSLMVSQEKQIWHCFGCHEGGDIFSFVMKMENLDFSESLKILADKAGVVLKKQDPRAMSKIAKLLAINELSAEFFHQFLLKSSTAEKARQYLAKRKINLNLINQFKLGYAPDFIRDRLSLRDFLHSRGYIDQDIFDAGLLSRGERGFYDRFRGRVIFPINDFHGQTVGFTARVLPENDDGKMGKYINSPQTEIYNKSRILYGLDKAKGHIREKKFLVVVEGNLDVISSHKTNVKNICASSGTALTSEQLDLIKRLTNDLYFCFDQDSAGLAATLRGIELAMGRDFNIKIITIKKGKDPDELINSWDNIESYKMWENNVSEAKPFMEYLFDQLFSQIDLNNIEAKKKSSAKFLSFVSQIYNPIEQSHWLKKMANKISVDESVILEVLKKQKKKNKILKKEKVREIGIVSNFDKKEILTLDRIFSIVIKSPDLLTAFFSYLKPEEIKDSEAITLYKLLAEYYNKYNQSSLGDNFSLFFSSLRDDKLKAKIDFFSLLYENYYSLYSPEEINQELNNLIKIIKKQHIKTELNYLQEQLLKIESVKTDGCKKVDSISELSHKFSQLTDQLSKLN